MNSGWVCICAGEKAAFKSHSKPKARQKCMKTSGGIYLFKLSEKLLQAEIQANHVGACERTPPTPCRTYIFFAVIQVEDWQGVRTGGEVFLVTVTIPPNLGLG